MAPKLISNVDDVQDYLARGVSPLPNVYAQFLEGLMERETAKLLCLLPSPRLELYCIRLEQKVSQRIRALREAA